jgi:hypothetical protein
MAAGRHSGAATMLTMISTEVPTNTSVRHPELLTWKEWRTLDFLGQIKHYTSKTKLNHSSSPTLDHSMLRNK